MRLENNMKKDSVKSSGAQKSAMAANRQDEAAIDQQIGQRLRLRRLTLGMSQQALGEAVGVSFQQIQKYERGIDRISSSKLVRLASHLGVPPVYFLDALNDQRLPDETPSTERTESDDLMRLFQQIKDPGMRELLLHIARKMRRI
jgi:transcriptional regulator with XRE-family HTH domain